MLNLTFAWKLYRHQLHLNYPSLVLCWLCPSENQRHWNCGHTAFWKQV